VEVFVRRGIAPDAGGAWILSRLIGIQKAKELFFFGDDVPAAEAYRIGLVNRVVPLGELQATLEEWAGRLASAPTKAIGAAKWLTNRALDVDRATALHDEAMVQELITNTLDSKEGVASFIERRPADFKGW
jgi:2-(1,2-epoxy-1,2-dihydrophenyl)acetyl-CoA isomerase